MYITSFWEAANDCLFWHAPYPSNAREIPWFSFLTYPEERFCPVINLYRIMEKVSISSVILEYAYWGTGSKPAANPNAAVAFQGFHKSSSHHFPQHSPLHARIWIILHSRKGRCWNYLRVPKHTGLRTGDVVLKLLFHCTRPKHSMLSNPLGLPLTVYSWHSYAAQISTVALKNLLSVLF